MSVRDLPIRCPMSSQRHVQPADLATARRRDRHPELQLPSSTRHERDARPDRPLDVLADFPAIPAGWAYLDTAATAQKPRPVIDAIARGYGETYATVHRGVYQRSADMTLAYEAARQRVARFIGGAADECVFVRGATEAINLVAQCWAGTQLKAGDRILLSTLEHHSNIVPWQMVAERVGRGDRRRAADRRRRIDLDAMAAMITPAHKLVALAHVSNVLGSVLDAKRATAIAHAVGAKILLDGCQAVPRMPVDVARDRLRFLRLLGAQALRPDRDRRAVGPRRTARGDAALAGRRIDDRPRHASRKHHLRAAAGPVRGGDAAHRRRARAARGDRLCRGHRAGAHPCARGGAGRATRARRCGAINSVRLFGPDDSAGIVSFAVEGVHPHDVATILDEGQVAIRAGHHCAQPLMDGAGRAGDGAGELRGV